MHACLDYSLRYSGYFYTIKGRIIRLDNLGKHFVVRLGYASLV